MTKGGGAGAGVLIWQGRLAEPSGGSSASCFGRPGGATLPKV